MITNNKSIYSVGSSIYNTWEYYAPQSWKTASPTTRLAIKGAVSLCLPGGALVQIPALVATIWSESIPSTPTVKESIAPTPPPRIPPVMPPKPSVAAAPSLGELKHSADQSIEKLTKTATDYATLYTMHSLICDIKEEHSDIPFQKMLAEISHSSNEMDVWKVFHKRYKDKLSCFQIAKARLFFFFCYQIPIIPNTIDAHIKKIVEVLRNDFIDDPKKQIQFIEKLINNNSDLFKMVSDETMDFARKDFIQKKEKRPLEKYIKRAVRSWLRNHPVHVPFSFGEKPLNWLLSKILKKWILPNLIPPLAQQIKKQLFENGSDYVRVTQKDGTQIIEKKERSYNPFFLIVTNQITAQLKELQKTIGEETAPSSTKPSTVQGIEKFSENLLEMIHLLPQEEVDTKEKAQARIETFKKKPKKIKDTEVQLLEKGVQLGIDFLSKPTTLEYFLALSADSTNDLFSNEIQVKSKSQWEEEQASYTKSKQELKTVIREILEQTIGAEIKRVTEEDPSSYLNAPRGKAILSALPALAGFGLYYLLPPHLAAPLNGLTAMTLAHSTNILNAAMTQDSKKAKEIAQDVLMSASKLTGAAALASYILPPSFVSSALALAQTQELASLAPPAVDQAIETVKTLALNETIEITDKACDFITKPLLYLANFRFLMRDFSGG